MASHGAGKLRIFRVPLNHRGTTDYLLKEALGNIQWPDYSSILYLAPTPSKVREAQRRFHRLVKHPYIPPRFATLKHLAMEFFNQEMPGRHLNRVLIPPVLSELSGQGLGYARLLSDLMRELKQHKPLSNFELIGEELLGIFSRLGIPEDARGMAQGALSIFGDYQRTISAAGYFDDDDILNYAPSIVNGMQGLFAQVLVVDGFTDMTASEQNLLSALVEKTWATFITSVEDELYTEGIGSYVDNLIINFKFTEEQLQASSTNDLPYVKYAGPEEEIEGVARHIKSLYVIGRLRANPNVIISFPRLQEQLALAERTLRRYGLPYSVSLQKPSASRPSLRDLFHLLDSVAEDFPRLKFTSFLNSPYFEGIPDDLKLHIPRMSLRSGLIKGRSSWEGIARATRDDAAKARPLDEGISHVFASLEGLLAVTENTDHAVFARSLKELLQSLGFNDDDGKKAIESALEISGTISALSKGKPLPLKRHTEFLRHILGSLEYRQEDSPIQLMDFSDTRGLETDGLYFCGLKDGDMPAKPPADLILPDSVRTEYGLINLKQYLALQKLDFLRLTGASREVHLSYPALEGDKVFLPSPFLPWASEAQEKVYGIFSEEELQSRKGFRLLSGSLAEIRMEGRLLERLTSKELGMPFRVTDIDAFRRCPRRFFIERVLGLEASEVAEYEVEARLLGTIIHRIMEKLLTLPLSDPQSARASADSVVDAILGEYVMENYWRSLIREAFLEMLPEITKLEADLRSEGFFPDRLEMKVEEEVLPGIRLRGKVDRIDRRDATFRIMDYKTGATAVGSEIIRKGKELQLPLYAAMLAARGMEVERAGVYSLRNIGIKWIPTARDRHSLKEYVTASLSYLQQTVSQLREGRFTAEPMEEFHCAACPEAPFCPYIHARGGTLRD